MNNGARHRIDNNTLRLGNRRDTLPLPPERRFPKLTVLSIAPLISRAIHEVFEDGSVTSLFDGNA